MSIIQCLDIGNTRTKLGVFKGTKMMKIVSFETKKLSAEANFFDSVIIEQNGPLCYCSVVPFVERILNKNLSNFTQEIICVNSLNRANLPLSYPTPEEIGADRIANAIAAFNILTLPAIVIDIGTATTFDVISCKGGYEGGVILPGPQGFLDYLHDSTALLPRVELSTNSNLSNSYGKSTKEAMLLGVRLGYKTMVGEIIKKISHQINLLDKQSVSVVLTGGSSTNFDLGSFPIHENLTLQGLKLAFEMRSSL